MKTAFAIFVFMVTTWLLFSCKKSTHSTQTVKQGLDTLAIFSKMHGPNHLTGIVLLPFFDSIPIPVTMDTLPQTISINIVPLDNYTIIQYPVSSLLFFDTLHLISFDTITKTLVFYNSGEYPYGGMFDSLIYNYSTDSMVVHAERSALPHSSLFQECFFHTQ